MRHDWQRPTAEEEARGIVAWYVRINSWIPDDVQPCPYSVQSMERRVQHWRKDKSFDLPYWIEPLPLVQPLNNSKEPDLDKLFDPENAEWELELSA